MSFTPGLSLIASITQAYPAVITTEEEHGLSDGNFIRLIVPQTYGMYPLNQLQVQVLIQSPTTFGCYYTLYPQAIPVNSLHYPAFSIPSMPGLVASVFPMGSGPTPSTDVAWQITNGLFTSPITDAVSNNSTTEIPF